MRRGSASEVRRGKAERVLGLCGGGEAEGGAYVLAAGSEARERERKERERDGSDRCGEGFGLALNSCFFLLTKKLPDNHISTYF